MAHFMPVDEQRAARLNEQLSKTIFQNVAVFVSNYNSGLINRNYGDVAKIAEEIVKTYRDVKERNKRLVFISEAEVHLNEIYSTLDLWSTIIRIKRDLNQHVDDNELSVEDTVVYTPQAVGYTAATDEDGDLVKISTEKLFHKQSLVGEIYEKFSTRKDEEKAAEEVYQFAVKDLINLDDSFVLRIKDELPL